MIIAKGHWPEPSQPVFEIVTDPVQIARANEVPERFKRNSDWLEAHRQELLPQAYGKCLAVAGQEAHIEETLEDAWAWVKATHPDDVGGAILKYVRPPGGLWIHALQR